MVPSDRGGPAKVLMPQQIAIVDYGMGNLHSVQRKFTRIGARTTVTSDPHVIGRAEKLVLPGVGHFQRAMENIRQLRLLEPLNEARGRGIPILGICLGMQLLAHRSEEGDTSGLGWLDARVVRFKVGDTVRFKVPHMGWNEIVQKRESALFKNIPDRAEFYFVHSYHLVANREAIVLSETEYDYSFASAVESENIFGVQFHPEKSHDIGESLLQNFTDL
jgi:imidazole glycerol-phosphate synthase subunit HisH